MGECSGSPAGGSSVGGSEGGCHLDEGAPVSGCSAAVHSELSAFASSRSLIFAEWNSEMRRHAEVMHSGEGAWGSGRSAGGWLVCAEGGQWRWGYLY